MAPHPTHQHTLGIFTIGCWRVEIDMKIPNNLPDFVGAVLSIVLGVVVSIEGYRIRSHAVSQYTLDHTLPAILGVLFIVLGTMLMISTMRDQEHEQDRRKTLPSPYQNRMILSLSTLGLYFLMLNIMGYLLATLIASVLLFRIVGTYRWARSVACALVLTGSLYLVFIKWLQISFPAGIFF